MLETIKRLITKLDEADSGAKYYKADLHTHTPKSTCFDPSEMSVTAEDIIGNAIKKGMGIIAITDHNTVDACESVLGACSDKNLAVFPGVEISTAEGHVLAIFDPSYTVSHINEMLIRLGLGETVRGNKEASANKPISGVIEEIERSGGVAIAAHISHEQRGFMRAIVDGGTRKKVYKDQCLRGLQIVDISERDDYLYGRKPGYETRKACILASDSAVAGNPNHCLDGTGNSYTNIKMDQVGIEGLKQALFDPIVRIKFPDEISDADYPQILGLFVDNGFLKENLYRFNPNLNCLIGGKGTGKSLTFEILRYVLAQQSSMPEIVDETTSLLESELGADGTAFLFISKDGARYCIVRILGDSKPAIFNCSDPENITEVDSVSNFDDFFKVKAYSQSEIIGIARNPEAQLSLIDDLIDISSYRNDIANIKESLRQNAEALINVDVELREIQVKLANIGVLQENIKILESKITDERLKNHQQWHEEERYVRGLHDTLQDLGDDSLEALGTVISKFKIPDIPGKCPNETLMQKAQEQVNMALEIVKASKSALGAELKKGSDAFDSIESSWQALFEEEEKSNQALLESLGIEGLETVEKRLNDLRKEESDLLSHKSRLETVLLPQQKTILEERDNLLNQLQQKRIELYELRAAKASGITGKLEENIRIRVHKANNKEDYRSSLTDLIRGSSTHKPVIDNIAEKIHPIPLVKTIFDRNYKKLAEDAGISEDNATRIIEHLHKSRSAREIFSLQLQDLDDLVEIQFRIVDQEYRNITKLSHGQKCMVILNIAMVEGKFPLLVDQPEDALDSPFIFDYVVSTLRAEKESRQFILTTHNANILVSSDTEQIFVMKASAERGEISATGSIDRFDTRDLVLLNLEGGSDAFNLRRKKYGLFKPVQQHQEVAGELV